MNSIAAQQRSCENSRPGEMTTGREHGSAGRSGGHPGLTSTTLAKLSSGVAGPLPAVRGRRHESPRPMPNWRKRRAKGNNLESHLFSVYLSLLCPTRSMCNLKHADLKTSSAAFSHRAVLPTRQTITFAQAIASRKWSRGDPTRPAAAPCQATQETCSTHGPCFMQQHLVLTSSLPFAASLHLRTAGDNRLYNQTVTH